MVGAFNRIGAKDWHREWFVGITINERPGGKYKGMEEDFFNTRAEAEKYGNKVVEELRKAGDKFKSWSVELVEAIVDTESDEVIKMPNEWELDSYESDPDEQERQKQYYLQHGFPAPYPPLAKENLRRRK